MFIKRPGVEKIHQLPDGEEIVSMVEYKKEIIIASNKNLYRLDKDFKLHRLMEDPNEKFRKAIMLKTIEAQLEAVKAEKQKLGIEVEKVLMGESNEK